MQSMEVSNNGQKTFSTFSTLEQPYDRERELKAFDNKKTGVKALVDAGVVKLPRIFIRPAHELAAEEEQNRSRRKAPSSYQLPSVLDLGRIRSADGRQEVVQALGDAAANWGFFHVVNHGIPLELMGKAMEEVRKFHELDSEFKKQYYSRDRSRRFLYSTALDLFISTSAGWRDTFVINSFCSSHHLGSAELPPVICRETMLEYIKHMKELANTLSELLMEVLGLKLPNDEFMECVKGCNLACHYYPQCPQPELTLGVRHHSDSSFFTIVQQDEIPGFQFFHDNQWLDVPAVSEGFLVNIGDLLQILSNNKFKSVMHRAIAPKIGPRICIAAFFNGYLTKPERVYGPIKELIKEDKPPLYKQFILSEYYSAVLLSKGLPSALEAFKL